MHDRQVRIAAVAVTAPANGVACLACPRPRISVDRFFRRELPNQLWLTDITEHPTREGKVYCAVVLDAFSRRVVGWSISHNPTTDLTTNALGMAIEPRDASRGTVID